MALFGNKIVCPICGAKIKGDILVTIKDNVPLCKSCGMKVSMDNSMIHEMGVEDMRAHLRYREDNKRRYDSMVKSSSAQAGAYRLVADGEQRLWYCTANKKDANPPVFTYDELDSMVYLENGEEVTDELKTGLGGLFGGKEEARTIRSMQVRIGINNPYHKEIVVELLNQEEFIQSGTMTYKKNRKALQGMMEVLGGIKGYDSQFSAGDAGVEYADAEVVDEGDDATDWSDDESI